MNLKCLTLVTAVLCAWGTPAHEFKIYESTPRFPRAGNVDLGNTNSVVFAGSASCYTWAPTNVANLAITDQPRYPFDLLLISEEGITHSTNIINMTGWESGSLTNLLYFRPHADGVKWELWH